MIDDPLYCDPDLVQFYDLENVGGLDFEYCLQFAEGAGSVLDLGCGTGQLATALAEGRSVYGVDPAGAMLAIARTRPNGNRVRWIEADARTVRLDRKFDLVLLTGHAFQVFLTRDDQRAVLNTIEYHLDRGGRFIFDMRNSVMEEWREWTPGQSQRPLHHPTHGEILAWNDVVFDPATCVATYATFYRKVATGEIFEASSKIVFVGQAEISAMIGEAGLAVDELLGDWRGAPYRPLSPEIIPVGRLA